MGSKTSIRGAEASDAGRITEIEIFNYRLNFYPIFRCDAFYFGELQVTEAARALAFYARHGFYDSGDRKLEEDTTEYLVRLARRKTG